MTWESIQQTFSKNASRFAERTAIRRPGQNLTYAQLESSTNRLANYLIAAGITKGSIVVILTDDSIQAITAILGVLKAGAVFVPLDPRTPQARLRLLLAELTPALYLTEAPFCDMLREVAAGLPPARLILLGDTPQPDAAAFPPDLSPAPDFADYADMAPPAMSPEPDDFCYVYFTSGSTGKPKGIMGRLKAIDHFIRWEVKTLGLDADCRVSQLTTPAFDACLRDIFVPLSTGGIICVPPSRDTLLDAPRLAEWLDTEQVNVVHCVPSVFRALLNTGLRPEMFSQLRYVLLSGEVVLPSDVKRWMDIFADRVPLINLYGPSETTMVKLHYFIQPSDASARAVPIGRPIDGARAILLDSRGNICPPGDVGEIYIRTPYRTLGYYKRPDLTAEVFVRNPFNDDPSDLIYKTGDQGRLLANGNLEFLGRNDFQVKIRGIRVELTEIENALRMHPAVQDTVVVSRSDPSGVPYLCAYVVLNTLQNSAPLRRFLAEHLPSYLIPSRFVVLESLPRTVTGKVDRNALSEPTSDGAGEPDDLPQEPIEVMVAGILAHVLDMEQIGLHTNFFAAGGHSLLATQVVSRMREAFQCELPLQVFFEAPTAAQLADYVRDSMRERTTTSLRLLQPVRRDLPLPLSSPQQRQWWLNRLQPGAHNIQFPVRLRGQLNAAALESSLNELIRRHEPLRTTFPQINGETMQVIAPEMRLLLPVIDLAHLSSQAREEEVKRLAMAAVRTPFDMEAGPLTRGQLVRLSQEEHVLLLAMDHIVSDGWSVAIFTRELSNVYNSLTMGSQPELSDLPIQYGDFAYWQRVWLREGALDQQRSYWAEQLAGAPPEGPMVTDTMAPATRSFRGAVVEVDLPEPLATTLHQWSQRESVSLFMTMLAAFNVALYNCTGQKDIVVGTSIANRNRAETEPLIGFFVNLLPLRTRLSENMTFRTLIHQVRKTCLDAYANQDLPFQELAGLLRHDKHPGTLPLFNVRLLHQNNAQPELRLDGLHSEFLQLPLPESIAHDLSLVVEETADGVTVYFVYDVDLFRAATVEQIATQLRLVLTTIVSEPEVTLEALAINHSNTTGGTHP